MKDMLPIIPTDDYSLPGLSPWTLWAKWSGVTQQPNSYHPLLCHLIDVAQCAQAMWRRVLPDAWKRRLATDLGFMNDLDDLDALALTERWVTFWAALHDLGKACPGFQLQIPAPAVQALLIQRFTAAGLPATPAPWVGHGDVSAHALRALLVNLFGLPRPAALAVALAVGGHHGRFPSPDDLLRLPSASLGGAPWDAARLRYARWLAQALGMEDAPPAPTRVPHAAAMALAGFVSVVDWIGSSETDFHHAAPDARTVPNLDVAAYLADSHQHADDALTRLGWTGWEPSTTVTLPFSALFPGKRPRPLQEAVIALADELTTPAIVIIEAPMGEGKTEAAMYLADRWTSRFGQRGVYFALPSQASSDQMFARVTDFLAQRYPHDVVNTQLLHGHAALSATLRELRARGRALLEPSHIYTSRADEDTDEDGGGAAHSGEGAVIAAEWFASAKRSILAPFGVGTVDQALLAALQTLHVFVRVYGLSTKTVIVDEVHAYDTYMLTLLSRLMEWLGALQAPVILLSATLPASRRRTLLAAYARGAGWDSIAAAVEESSLASPQPAAEPASTPYPRVTWADSQGAGARAFGRDSDRIKRPSQPVTLEWLAPAAEDLAARLDGLLDEGGCAAVICNTVASAQRLYRALRPRYSGDASDGDPQLDLLHARFPLEERALREERAIRRFGLQGPRPRRALLIATQIIEQSLDLDFDLLATELAPADLVLQRMGRMHRHDRPRPAPLSAPRLLLLAHPADVDGVPALDPGSQRVYDPHILLRSWLALQRQGDAIALPEDIEPLVESVYSEDNIACPPDGSPALRARWDETLADQRRAIEEDQQQARQRYIGAPWSTGLLSDVAPFLRDEDAPELHPAFQALTRLTEQNVTIVCLGGTPEAPLLRPGGPPVSVSLHAAPTFTTTEAFLRRSLTISDRRIVFQLLEQEVPPAWRTSSLLRRLRPVCFDADGVAVVGRWRLRLHPDEGLLIEANATPTPPAP